VKAERLSDRFILASGTNKEQVQFFPYIGKTTPIVRSSYKRIESLIELKY